MIGVPSPDRPAPRSMTGPGQRLIPALVGAGITLLLYALYTATWPYWLRSMGPGYRLAVAAGQIEVSLFGTPSCTLMSLAVLLVAAAIVGWVGPARRRPAIWMWLGIMAAVIGTWSRLRDFPGNLWPISLAMFMVMTAAPVIGGILLGSGLRAR